MEITMGLTITMLTKLGTWWRVRKARARVLLLGKRTGFSNTEFINGDGLIGARTTYLGKEYELIFVLKGSSEIDRTFIKHVVRGMEELPARVFCGT
jgi:hypothetical protein